MWRGKRFLHIKKQFMTVILGGLKIGSGYLSVQGVFREFRFLIQLLCWVGWWVATYDASAQRETLGVLPVKVIPSVAAKLSNGNKTWLAEQMSQSLTEQFSHSINASRKFQVVARSDLKEIITDDEKSRVLNLSKIKGFNLADTRYLAVLTVDDYEDQTQRLEQPLVNKTLTKRTVRLSLVAKIYESTTGKLLESSSKSIISTDAQQTLNETTSDAGGSDNVIRAVVKESADWAANQVVDAIFPIKVVARTDKAITVNRGEGSVIAPDQIWRVFAVGKEIVDPDTKESLGKDEVEIGKVRIVDVLPRFSRATVLDDRGITEGSILRR